MNKTNPTDSGKKESKNAPSESNPAVQSKTSQTKKVFNLKSVLRIIWKNRLLRIVVLVLVIICLGMYITKDKRYVFFDRVTIHTPGLQVDPSFTKGEIVNTVNQVLWDTPTKIASILGVPEDSVTVKEASFPIGVTEGKKDLLGPSWIDVIIERVLTFIDLRSWVKRNDIVLSVQMRASNDSLITRYLVEDVKTHQKSRLVSRKNNKDLGNAFDKTITEIAARTALCIDPISAILCDYQVGRNEYEVHDYWPGSVFKKERDTILRKDNLNSPYAKYRHLILGDIKYSDGRQKSDTSLLNNAIAEFEIFLNENSNFKEAIASKITSVEDAKHSVIPSSPIDLLERVLKKSWVSQLIIVTAKEYNTSKDSTALMHCLEKKNGKWTMFRDSIKVHIGVGGLAPIEEKEEGDKRTPSGQYQITGVFGQDESLKTGRMDYRLIGDKDLWVTDVKSKYYNQLKYDTLGIAASGISYEKLTDSYIKQKTRYGIIFNYNKDNRKRKGSAIYIHIDALHISPSGGTAGCISLKENDLADIIKWLDKVKSPNIWIGKEADYRHMFDKGILNKESYEL